jgi:hypothetical protein
MNFIYKTIYYSGNPKAEYQKRGNQWFKRVRGAKTEFYLVDVNGSKVLDKAYATKGSLYFYSDTFKLGAGLAVAGIFYFLYKRASNKVKGNAKLSFNISKQNGKPTT